LEAPLSSCVEPKIRRFSFTFLLLHSFLVVFHRMRDSL
jgi:hypothetical protein